MNDKLQMMYAVCACLVTLAIVGTALAIIFSQRYDPAAFQWAIAALSFGSGAGAGAGLCHYASKKANK